MINCRLFLEKHFPHLAENFIVFTSPSVSSLVTQLDDVINKLQLVHQKELPEVLVEIEFQSVANLNESDVHALSNFVVAKTDILFCFHVLNTSSLPSIVQEKLQSKLDESFWRAVSIWRQKKFKPKENLPFSSMLKLLFPNGLPTPTLTITTPDENQCVESSLPTFMPPQQPMHMSSFVIPQRMLHKYQKYKLDKKDVLSIFPEEMITMIMACLDSKELSSFKQQLLVFKPEELLIIQKLFFSGERQQDILKLLLPSGFSYLKICAAWVHTGLIPHWLNWLQQSDIAGLSFTQAVDYMQYFWLRIKDAHPHIPITRSQMITAPAQHAYSFQNRITDMLKLVDEVEPAFKKVQIESLFDFDWHHFEFYQTLLKDYHCFWIHPVMLQQQMITRAPNQPLPEANQVAYFQYVSQHIQDKTNDALKSIYQYAQYNRQHEGGELLWQMSAWCGSLPHVANLTLYNEVLDWVDDLSPDIQIQMVDALFAIPKEQRFQCEVFVQFTHFVGSNASLMIQLLLFYRQWHSFPESTSESWGQLLNQLMYRHDEEVLLQLFQVGTEIEQQLVDSSGAFFKCLMILFAYEQAESLVFIQEVCQLFATLQAKQKLECLSILSSYEPIQQRFPLEPLRFVINDIQLQQLSLEQSFSTHYRDFHFSYFKTVIDYQLVYQKMEDLIANIKESIHFFLSDDKIYGLFNIRSCMQEEVHLILAKQDERLNQVSAELKSLKLKTDDIDLSGLFQHLKAFEAFFMDFIEWKLGRLFGENGVLLAGYGRFISPVIHRLDKSLSAQSTLKQLMEVVLKKHDLVSQSAIGLHFKADMLQLLLEDSNTPLMQRFLQKRLVNEIILKLDSELSQTHFPIADAKFKQLFNFLHELPLEPEQVHFFFQRYQSIQYVVKVWPYIHHQLQAFHVDSDQVWDVCIKHQFEQGKPYSAAHWKIALKLIELMLDLQQQTELPNHFSYLRFLDGFFKAKPSLAQIHLQGNGDIKHENWAFLILQMRHAIKIHSRNPMFLNILPRAIEHILNEGNEFHFERHLEMMTKIGKNPEIFPRLMRLLNEDNPQVQDQLQSIFIHIGQLLELQDGRPWARLVAKILNFEQFEMHLQAIEPFLVWIKQETAFNWVELIVDDERVELEDILRFPQLLQTPSLWVDVYQKQYLTHTQVEPIEPIVEPLSDVVEKQVSTQQRWSTRIWNWINSSEERSVDILEIEDDDISEEPLIAADDELEQEQKKEWVSCAWKIFEMAPYASVRQIQQWLTAEPESVKQPLEIFDCYPFGQIEPYFFTKSDMERWISRLEFYEFDVPVKAKIAERLTNILALTNRAFLKSRTSLIEEFAMLTQKMRKTGTRKDTGLQDNLIATIAAIYCKSTHRKPYPTQLLTLLMTLEYRARNIVFEVDTGEGKGITTALLAVLKWSLREDATIEIRTANQDLVRQDYYGKGHWRLFELLGIHHAIIQKDSPPESYQRGGIYYCTHDDIHVFQECRRLAGFDRKVEVDVITDEVDSSILDQTSMINLAKPNHQLKDIHWVYAYINQFLDEALKLDKYSQSLVLQQQESNSPVNRSHSPVVAETFQPSKPKMISEHRIKDWLVELGHQLKNYVIQHNKENIFRLNQMDYIHEDQWKDWLLVAAYASTLRENQHYVVEAVEHNGQKFHRVVPYVNGEIKYGFELSFQMKPGLMQLLQARLARDGRLFVAQPESQLISQLTINDFEHVKSFVGLSASIGSLSESSDMMKSTESGAIRISRYYDSGLEELPALLMEDETALLNKICHFVMASNHPMLFVLQRIEDASSLYLALKQHLPSHKHLRLLTGQESEEERRDWLHAKQSGLYAGSPNAVTVSTLICGRGTDISVSAPLYLMVKQIGILDPRNVVQIKGRTARINNQGSFQVLYNKQALIHDWGRLCASLPLHLQTLNIWVEKIQHHLISETRNRCMNLRIKGWCQRHLIRNLERCFDNAQFTFQEKSNYYLMVSLALQQLGLEKHFDEDIVDKYIQLSLNIWQRILSKFEMDGYPQKDFSVASFHNSLVNDRDSWSSIVTKSISEEPVPTLILPPVMISEKEIANLIQDIGSIIPNQHFERQKDTKPTFWSWLYDAPDLVKETAGFLSQTWRYLELDPNQENWIAFYQTLCSAHELFNQQYSSNFWQISYWIRLLNPLYDWLKVFHQVQLFVQKNMIISKQNDGFYLRVQQRLMDIIPKITTHSVLWQAVYDWWRRAMSFFNSDIHQSLINVSQAYLAFNQNPCEQTLNEFCHRLKDAELLFQEAKEWRSWRIGYWFYWHHQCQPWLELAKNMKQVIEDCNRTTLDAQLQQRELDEMSHVKLVYRQHLLEQKSKIQSTPSYSYWSWFSTSSQVKHSPYEQVLKRTDIQKYHLIHYEIHELSLMYGMEIQELYKLFYPNSSQDLEDEQKPLYSLLLKVMSAYFNPLNSDKIRQEFAVRPMTVLLAEIQRYSTRRELLVEWDRNKVLGNLLF